MLLSIKQRKFGRLLGIFFTELTKAGIEYTVGEVERSRLQAKANADAGIGVEDSLHCLRLAVDLNLFVDGVYQAAGAVYERAGAIWKSLDPECRWGGDFKTGVKGDVGHFEVRP